MNTNLYIVTPDKNHSVYGEKPGYRWTPLIIIKPGGIWSGNEPEEFLGHLHKAIFKRLIDLRCTPDDISRGGWV